MTIFTRSALVHWGHAPAPDVARVEVGPHGRRVVTWAEVMADRRAYQRRRLDDLRRVEEWRACKLWVAYFDQPLMGGWQAFLEDRRGRTWIDRDGGPGVRGAVAGLFPCTLLPGWEDWKRAFAARFRRRTQDREPVGVAYLWRRGRALSRRPTTAG